MEPVVALRVAGSSALNPLPVHHERVNDAFATRLHAHRADLLRIARLQLRDADAAEDAVQETLIAALRSRATFAGQATLKTWLVGILKFKIVDALRRSAREPLPASSLKAELDAKDLDRLFDEHGVWQHKPAAWHDPQNQVQQADFLRVLELCLTRVPRNSARVFMLRELFGLESEEICELLSLSRSNLGVLLYRARLSLRRCLESSWFTPAENSA